MDVRRCDAPRHASTIRHRVATPNPTPYALHPTPHALHPAPYTPHSSPCTLHPTPHTPEIQDYLRFLTIKDDSSNDPNSTVCENGRHTLNPKLIFKP